MPLPYRPGRDRESLNRMRLLFKLVRTVIRVDARCRAHHQPGWEIIYERAPGWITGATVIPPPPPKAFPGAYIIHRCWLYTVEAPKILERFLGDDQRSKLKPCMAEIRCTGCCTALHLALSGCGCKAKCDKVRQELAIDNRPDRVTAGDSLSLVAASLCKAVWPPAHCMPCRQTVNGAQQF